MRFDFRFAVVGKFLLVGDRVELQCVEEDGEGYVKTQTFTLV